MDTETGHSGAGKGLCWEPCRQPSPHFSEAQTGDTPTLPVVLGGPGSSPEHTPQALEVQPPLVTPAGRLGPVGVWLLPPAPPQGLPTTAPGVEQLPNVTPASAKTGRPIKPGRGPPPAPKRCPTRAHLSPPQAPPQTLADGTGSVPMAGQRPGGPRVVGTHQAPPPPPRLPPARRPDLWPLSQN